MRTCRNTRGRMISGSEVYDCVVCGGGTAGVAAAVSAARAGERTLIVERGIVLGGSQTQGLVVPMMPTFAEGSDTPWVTEARSYLRSQGIEPDDGVTGTTWTNPDMMADFYDAVTSENGIDILYNAVIFDAECDDGKILSVLAQTIEGAVEIRGRVFIDATGDAVVARLAGVPCESGNEETGLNQPMSLRFEMEGIDLERLHRYLRDTLHDKRCETAPPHVEVGLARHRAMRYAVEPLFVAGIESGELAEEDAEYFQAFAIPGKDGCMAMNCPELPTRFSATDAMSYSRGITHGRSMMRRIAKFVRAHLPGFENARISRQAQMVGARESWRIKGRAYLTEDDYHARRRFADAVCRTGYYIDAHGGRVGEYLPRGEFYEIPYRAMVASEAANLIVAGRCISVSFILQSSMRIQPTCMSIGEAAGIAAAHAVKNEIDANEVDWSSVPNRSYVSCGAIS